LSKISFPLANPGQSNHPFVRANTCLSGSWTLNNKCNLHQQNVVQPEEGSGNTNISTNINISVRSHFKCRAATNETSSGGKVPHAPQKCTEVDIEGGEFAWELFAHYKAVHLQGDIILEPLHRHIVPFQIVELLLFGRTQL